jgi:hypothetical protein
MKTKIALAPLIIVLILPIPHIAYAEDQTSPTIATDVTSDFKYIVNNSVWDVEDIVTSPLYAASPESPLRSPKFYLVLAGAGALWGGSYALDQTMKSHLQGMGSSNADL